MNFELPEMKYIIENSVEGHERYLAYQERRLYLIGGIEPVEDDEDCLSKASQIVDDIISYNRQDAGLSPDERMPIRLYINSPGGDIREGFSIVSAIELSKTPVYTINIGTWYSMAFLIGIAGHKRFALPYMRFLMHDGFSGIIDSGSKVQDRVAFDVRFEREVIKPHVLKYSNMEEKTYDNLVRVEYYLLPEDAKEHGFIDEIVTDIDTIL